MYMPVKRYTHSLAIIGAVMLCAACYRVDDAADAYVDHTNEPLAASADGRLADLGVTCRLAPVQRDSNEVEIQLENHGDAVVEFLTRGTMWDELSPALRVSMGDRELPYMGIIAHRGPPTASEFERIEPGEMLTRSYDVGRQHHGHQPGAYEISLRDPVINVRVADVALAMQHDCGVLHVRKSTASPRSSEIQAEAQALIYNDSSCTADEQTQIENMEEIARPATTIARSFVGAGNPLYTQWFGSWSSNNGDYVDQVLSDIEAGWDSFEGDCDVNSVSGCTGSNICASANAWVCVGDDPDLVHICDGFFGTPSFSVEAWSNQVGILAHEKSHLVSGDGDQSHSSCTDGGDTKCYGAPDARALAINSPSQAIQNGENYEKYVAHAYFVSVILPVVL